MSREDDMARRTKSTIAGAVADSVTDAVATAIGALAHPATTVGQARDAIVGATRKAATAKRKVAARKGGMKRSVEAAVGKAKRKVAAKKGAAKRVVKKAAKKVRRR